jgi:hypothetical protein
MEPVTYSLDSSSGLGIPSDLTLSGKLIRQVRVVETMIDEKTYYDLGRV